MPLLQLYLVILKEQERRYRPEGWFEQALIFFSLEQILII